MLTCTKCQEEAVALCVDVDAQRNFCFYTVHYTEIKIALKGFEKKRDEFTYLCLSHFLNMNTFKILEGVHVYYLSDYDKDLRLYQYSSFEHFLKCVGGS